MSSRHINTISARLSLRTPQRESLEILARVAELVPLDKERDLAAALALVRDEFPSVQSFERDFPSLCFALATGVGKTRLMGAFMAYLRAAHGVRHFFVLAPNLTIYNKLVLDFTPGHPKYVLAGLAEFAAEPPEVITGDNYESGRGVRKSNLFGDTGVHINVFNVSKINSEVRGGKAPLIRRLSEYIGESYFDYLAGLDDLVLMMDESHRYRASAGVKALNELNPVLGLELTATPKVETPGGPLAFRNVIYNYPLSQALKDGFVKEPAVATRENFNAAAYTPTALERLKLEDGVRVHESVKVDLETYARQNDAARVKPFMLVVAQDTAHADALKVQIERDDFFEGRYQGRVITVHSNLKGEERDETVQQLVDVENPDNVTEIVVHVNKLKEGWDVRNLYTIVPLRAAKSEILTEQTIGRGLRLPFGKRTGVPALDRLTIIAHDSFQAIIDEANNPNSIIRVGVVIGRDVPVERKEAVVVTSVLEALISATPPASMGSAAAAPLFATPAAQQVAQATLAAIHKYERLPNTAALKTADIQAALVSDVKAAYQASQAVQGTLVGTTEEGVEPDFVAIVAQTTTLFEENVISIPRLVVQPRGEVTSGFHPFTLDVGGIHLQPVEQQILIKHLHNHEMFRLAQTGGAAEDRIEDYLVRDLIGYDDISYDEHADLLYSLAGACVTHLRSYLPDEDAVVNVLQFHQKRLAEIIHTQMQTHYYEGATGYDVRVTKGFMTLRENNFSAVVGEDARDFRQTIPNKKDIRNYVFAGFRRCLYPRQKFDSDPERRFAVLLEDASEVVKWFKPARKQFQIYYGHDEPYEPDFVVETKIAKLMCEPKRAEEMQDAIVRAKAEAAVVWCARATEHELANGGKPWSYLLIEDTAISEDKTLSALIATCKCI